MWSRDRNRHGGLRIQRQGGAADFNLAERLALDSHDLLKADQFEHRQKGNDHFRAARNPGKQFREIHLRPFAESAHKLLDFFTNRPFIFENVSQVLAFGEPLEDRVHCIDQVKNRNLWTGRCCGLELQLARGARKNVVLARFHHRELGRGIFEFFVFDQLPDQFPTRIFALVVAFDLRLLIDGQ